MTHGTFLFLGTGASAGIPMVGCSCSVCSSKDPHNQRLRPSGLLEIAGKTLLIDTSPDLRQQALRFKIKRLDGVLLTHTHFDHVGGIDELRAYYLIEKKPIPLLSSQATFNEVQKRYYYLMKEKSRSISLPAQIDFQQFEGERGQTQFLGVPLSYMTYEQGGMAVNGFRFGDFAYVCDIRHFSETIYEDLKGVKCLILSALRHSTSPMHFNLDEAVAFSKQIGAKQTWFTHIAHDLDHEATNEMLPEGIKLAYDGLKVEF